MNFRFFETGVKPAIRFCLPVLFLLFAAQSGMAQMPGQDRPGLVPATAQQSEHGMRATVGAETLDVTVCGASVIHVVAKADAAAQTGPQPWMLDAGQSCAGAPFQFTQDKRSAKIKTDALEVSFNLERGFISFRAANGDSLLRERDSIPRTYEPMQVNGESTYRITDRFSPVPEEAFFGFT